MASISNNKGCAASGAQAAAFLDAGRESSNHQFLNGVHNWEDGAYALKQLVTAGVKAFFYLEDRERTLDSPTDKIMLSLMLVLVLPANVSARCAESRRAFK